jgi:hypothetical protein
VQKFIRHENQSAISSSFIVFRDAPDERERRFENADRTAVGNATPSTNEDRSETAERHTNSSDSVHHKVSDQT